jgi:hypothetical protein
MHAITLALAHIEPDASNEFGLFLARASSRQIITQALGKRPPGITRVLKRLPTSVLEPEEYRDVVKLLNKPKTAKVLHHADQIDASRIRLLSDLPAALSHIAKFVFDRRLGNVEGFTDALRFLVSHGAASSFEALVADFATIRRPGQLIGKIKHLVESLPLPDSLPPALIGNARRIDRPTELRALAKRWQNCLADYMQLIDDGGHAVYLWEDKAPAICLAERCGRLGWFLDQVKGPGNADLDSERLEPIEAAFSSAGVPDSRILHPIQSILFTS